MIKFIIFIIGIVLFFKGLEFILSHPFAYYKSLFGKSGNNSCSQCIYYLPRKGFIGGICKHTKNYSDMHWGAENYNLKNNCLYYFFGVPRYKELEKLCGQGKIGHLLSEPGLWKQIEVIGDK
jgi:hypothetical protein